MKNAMLVLVWLTVTGASPLWAQEAGNAGVGIILGNPSGVTGKFWTTEAQAVDAGIGYSTKLAVYGDYLWHNWKLLPQPAEGKLPVYMGLGAQIRALDDTEFGIRAVSGLAYWLPRNPVEIFLEVVPVFRLAPGVSVGLDAGLGLRYYFR